MNEYRRCNVSHDHDPKGFFTPDGEAQPRIQPGSHARRVAPERDDSDETAIEHEVGSTDYKAYGVLVAGNKWCEIRHWKPQRQDMAEFASYDYRLLSAIYASQLDLEGAEWEVDLTFPDSLVRVKGRHLQDLRRRLQRQQISFIQQYSPMVHRVTLAKLPEDEPVITEVYVMRGGKP